MSEPVNFPVYDHHRSLVAIIVAEDEKHAREILLKYANSEEDFMNFYNKVWWNHIVANPYYSALEDRVFLSSSSSNPIVSEDKAKESRLQYIRKNYYIGTPIHLFGKN